MNTVYIKAGHIEDESGLYLNRIKQAVSVIEAFFSLKIKLNCKIEFIQKRSEMDTVKGYKTPDWMAGNTNSKSRTVTIFDEDSFSKETNHPADEFFSTLVHEICHLFFSQEFKFSEPKWLNEGLAGFIAEQRYSKKFGDILNMHTYEEWKLNGGYSIAIFFVNFLVEKFGSNKILSLMKRTDLLDKEGFLNLFKEIYGVSLPEVVVAWEEI